MIWQGEPDTGASSRPQAPAATAAAAFPPANPGALQYQMQPSPAALWPGAHFRPVQEILSEALSSFPAAMPQLPQAGTAAAAAPLPWAGFQQPMQQPHSVEQAAPQLQEAACAQQQEAMTGHPSQDGKAGQSHAADETHACSRAVADQAAWPQQPQRPLSAPSPAVFPLLQPRRQPPPPPLQQPAVHASTPQKPAGECMPAGTPPAACQPQQDSGAALSDPHAQASSAGVECPPAAAAAMCAAVGASTAGVLVGDADMDGWQPMSTVDRAKCERAYDGKVR